MDADYQGYEQQHHHYQPPHPGPSPRSMPTSPPHLMDPNHFSGSRRGNRTSQMTTSSSSTDTSSLVSPSTIRPGQPWGLPADLGKRPSVATVFEDEPLQEGEHDGIVGQQEYGIRGGEWHNENDHYRRSGRSSGLQLSTSAPTPNRMYGPGTPSTRAHRSSTVSTTTTSSAKSKSSGHPFAMNRAPSPLLVIPEQLPAPSQGRPMPNMYDGFKRDRKSVV